MRFTALPAASLAAAVALSGCHSAPDAVNVAAKTITLTDALRQIRDALEQSHLAATTSGQYLGLDPCTVTVAFTVTLTGTADNKLGVTLAAAPPTIPVSLGFSGSSENTLVANRGNVITLNMVSPACNPTGTLGTIGTAAKVEALAKANANVRKSKNSFLDERLPPGRFPDLFPQGGTDVVPPTPPTTPPTKPAPAK